MKQSNDVEIQLEETMNVNSLFSASYCSIALDLVLYRDILLFRYRKCLLLNSIFDFYRKTQNFKYKLYLFKFTLTSFGYIQSFRFSRERNIAKRRNQ